MTNDLLSDSSIKLLLSEDLPQDWYLDIYGGNEAVGFDKNAPIVYVNVEGPGRKALRLRLWISALNNGVWAHYLSPCCGDMLMRGMVDLHCQACDKTLEVAHWDAWQPWSDHEAWVFSLERNLGKAMDSLLAATIVAAVRGCTPTVAGHLLGGGDLDG